MGVLLALLQYLLPHRTVQTSFADVRHHDERAAVVCALTALCVAVGDYTVVGDKKEAGLYFRRAHSFGRGLGQC
jgi:hypothetical protein